MAALGVVSGEEQFFGLSAWLNVRAAVDEGTAEEKERVERIREQRSGKAVQRHFGRRIGRVGETRDTEEGGGT